MNEKPYNYPLMIFISSHDNYAHGETRLDIHYCLLYITRQFLHVNICYYKRAPSGRDPHLRGKVIQSTTIFFQNIIKFVYETNNTFVTWNRNIKTLIKTVIYNFIS